VTRERRPLVITTDAELLDDVLGAAAAVGVATDVAVDAGSCGPQWRTAPLVLLGDDLARAVVSSGLPLRPRVLLISRGALDPDEQMATASSIVEEFLRLPADEAVLTERLADVLEPPASGRIIGVLPGRGGAGASVLATATALTAAARGDAAWLVDLDPLGGGADAGLGAELLAGARWDDLGGIAGRVSSRALRAALPETCGVAVLSCGGRADADPAPPAVRAVLAATRRSGGTVVMDLPRHPSATVTEALSAADDLLLLVPAEVRAVLAARRLVGRLGTAAASLRVVVRRVPDGLPPREVARGLGADLVGDYVEEPSVRAALLNGVPRDLTRGTELGALCDRILDGPARREEAS
jgi:secretion/DNA translocation related CpaE-like protein